MSYFKILSIAILIITTGCGTLKTEHHITLQHNIAIELKPIAINMKHELSVDDNKTQKQLARLVRSEISKMEKSKDQTVDFLNTLREGDLDYEKIVQNK